MEILRENDAHGVGGRARLMVASALGYRLKLLVETTEANPPHYLFTRSTGDLEGTGEWVFEQKGDTTYATWTWIVESHHPLLNLLEPLAKRVFEWSHNDASGKGQRGLKRLLEKQAAGAQTQAMRTSQ